MSHELVANTQEEKVYEGLGRKRLRMESAEYAEKKKVAEECYRAYGDALRDGDQGKIEAAKLQFEIANKTLELFDLTHDATGARRGELFGRELGKEIQEAIEHPDQRKALEKRFVFVVNMGELDRLNKEGGHSGGDLGLEATAQAIEGVLHKTLGDRLSDSEDITKYYQTYRLSGNEFAVRLAVELEADQAEALREAIQAQKASVPGVKEGPPLCARSLSMARVLELVPVPPDVKELGMDTEEIQRRSIGVAKDLLFTLIDEEKLVTRMERLAQKLQESPGEAQAFFDNYLKKSLKDMVIDGQPLETFEQAVAALRALPAEGVARWEALHAPALQASIDQLHRTKKDDREGSEKLATYVKQAALQRTGASGSVAEVRTEAPAKTELTTIDRSKETPSTFRAADPKSATEGLKLIAGLEEKLQAQRVLMEAGSGNADQLRLATLSLEIERAKRDTATGLELKGGMYRMAQEAFAAGKAVATVGIDMGFLKYFDKVGGGKTGDAAILKSAELFDRALREGSERFNTLKRQNPSLTARAFRPGGDEFSIVITGEGVTEEDLQKVVAEMKAFLLRQTKEAGPVPAMSDAAAKEYIPTSLMVSLGSEVFASAEQGKNKLAKNGVELSAHEMETSALEQNALAAKLFQVADLELEVQKSFERFRTLRGMAARITELRGATSTASQREYADACEQYRQLLIFSEKALGAGGQEWLAAKTGIEVKGTALDTTNGRSHSVDELKAMDAELLLHVFEMVEKKHGEERERDLDAEQRIELMARLEYMRRQVEVLKEDLGAAHKDNESYKQLMVKMEEGQKRLELRAKTAEEDLAQVVNLRKAAA